jgi:hypothetical protein
MDSRGAGEATEHLTQYYNARTCARGSLESPASYTNRRRHMKELSISMAHRLNSLSLELEFYTCNSVNLRRLSRSIIIQSIISGDRLTLECKKFQRRHLVFPVVYKFMCEHRYLMKRRKPECSKPLQSSR